MSARPYETTPAAGEMNALLGYHRLAGIRLSRDEYRAACRLYEFEKEAPDPALRPPLPPPLPEGYVPGEVRRQHERATQAHEGWDGKGAAVFAQAGADRNLARELEADGARVVSWLARYLSPGDDPLKAVVRLAISAGWDVNPSDAEWVAEAEVES